MIIVDKRIIVEDLQELEEVHYEGEAKCCYFQQEEHATIEELLEKYGRK